MNIAPEELVPIYIHGTIAVWRYIERRLSALSIDVNGEMEGGMSSLFPAESSATSETTLL